MILIYKSPHLGSLARRLAGMISEEKPGDPFEKNRIIVPNLETARWLKLFLAEQNGFAGNLDFMLPAEWQWLQVRNLHPDLPDLLPSDPGPMTWTLFQLLRDPGERDISPRLNAYIRHENPATEEQAAWQLARQISSVFDQYLVYRPEMILRWQAGSRGEGEEIWQAELWRRLQKRWVRDNTGLYRKNKADLYQEALDAAGTGNGVSKNPLYVFNPGLIPIPTLKLLRKAAAGTEVLVFSIKPSAVAGRKEKKENELLESFGDEAAIREETLKESLAGEEQTLSAGQKPETNNLDVIRQSVIQNKPLPQLSGPDSSVQIRCCHSELREVETLRDFLLDCFERDPELKPDDVLVVMPEPEKYAPFVEAVFGVKEAGLPDIPYHLSRSGTPGGAMLPHAFVRLLEIADSRLAFTDVFDFLKLPVVRETFGLTENDLMMVMEWFRENRVVWGFDASHRTDYQQPEEDLQTWRSALKRGWTGQIYGGVPGRFRNGTLPYYTAGSRDEQFAWASVSSFLYSLETVYRETGKPRTAASWNRLFIKWSELFFSEMIRDGREGLFFRQHFDRLEQQVSISGNQEPVSFSLMRSAVKDLIEDYASGSVFFNRGVVFSSMVPARSFPFKIIALLGLNDDIFPRKAVHPDFDLMAEAPRKGERDRKNEDKNLFLESILAAEQAHYCSYIGRSQKDNEVIPPSVILAEWIAKLEGASGIKEDKWTHDESLYGFSQVSAGSMVPVSIWSGVYVRTAKEIPGKGETGLHFHSSLPGVKEEETFIGVEDLVRFYGNPVRSFLKKRFGARLEEPEDETSEFTADGLDTHILFQRVFGWVLERKEENEIRELLIKSGILLQDWPGIKILEETIARANSAEEIIRKKRDSIDTEMNDISIPLGNNEIEGNIKSYSKDFFLDITPSGSSGKVLFSGWVKHLCMMYRNKDSEESVLFTDLKKAGPKQWVFARPEKPEILLEDLAGGYREGLLRPMLFFPKTAFEYLHHSGDESSALKAAEKAWSGGSYNRGYDFSERNDAYIRLLLGDDPAADIPGWKKTFQRYMQPMIDHLREEE